MEYYDPTNKQLQYDPTNQGMTEGAFTQELGLIVIAALIFIISFVWKDYISDMQDCYLSKTHPFYRMFFTIGINSHYCMVYSLFKS